MISPPGNFAATPVVYRGPYEYSVPGMERDYLPQDDPTETAADTGADPQTSAHMRNWMECVRSRNQKTNADIHAAYNHSTALCMTIAALQTGKRVTFDSKKRAVVTG